MGMKKKFSRFFELDEEESDQNQNQESASFSRKDGNRYTENKTVPIVNARQDKTNKKVVSFNQQTTTSQTKITILEPRVYSEVQEIADILLKNQSVVLNFIRMDEEQAKRIVDFLTGTVYALGGDIQRVGDEIFLCTPENVSIDGTLTDIMGKNDLY